MQNIETLHTKFVREQKELADEDAKGSQGHQWDELPDVTYYTACMVIVDGNHDYSVSALLWLSSQINGRNVTVKQLEAGTLAKYRMRAGYEKSLIAERNAIEDAVAAA